MSKILLILFLILYPNLLFGQKSKIKTETKIIYKYDYYYDKVEIDTVVTQYDSKTELPVGAEKWYYKNINWVVSSETIDSNQYKIRQCIKCKAMTIRINTYLRSDQTI